MNLQEIFAQKTSENGDLCFNKASQDNLINLLFMSEFYNKHVAQASIGNSDKEKLFAMFMRDPRFGLGRRDLGRKLMHDSGCTSEDIVKAGRFDDLFSAADQELALSYWKQQIAEGNELAKKWAPRYSSKNLMIARALAKKWGFNKQDYGHFIKTNTTEQKLSRKATDAIEFEHVPSLAMLKYYNRFQNGADTKERFAKYLDDVKTGKKELHVSTSTVYDIYKNREKIDPDLFFSKMKKISLSCIPIVDTSGSMWDSNDSFGKALSIGHYLAKSSTYAPNQVISFSSHPQLITLGEVSNTRSTRWASYELSQLEGDSQYMKEIRSMYTGDCTNTDFGAVMDLLSQLDSFPEYLIVLSDMEFDKGSHQSTAHLEHVMKEHHANTKLVWWNFNSRATTAPEMDNKGNIFISGYNPQLLQFLQVGFDANKFLETLLSEYAKAIQA